MGTRIFEKDSNCVTRQIGTETIIVPVRASAADLRAIYTLNESATEIWYRIDGSTSVKQIAQHLCSVYEVPLPEAEGDVGELLNTLSSAGLVCLKGD
jgi:hypothetical protein